MPATFTVHIKMRAKAYEQVHLWLWVGQNRSILISDSNIVE